MHFELCVDPLNVVLVTPSHRGEWYLNGPFESRRRVTDTDLLNLSRIPGGFAGKLKDVLDFVENSSSKLADRTSGGEAG